MKNKNGKTSLCGLTTLLAVFVSAVACLSPTATALPTAFPSPTATVVTAVPSPSPTVTPQPPPYTQAIINGHAFSLEVADTPAERTKGLMGRPSLPEDNAMLFVFPMEGIHPFWMKDTLIPLDILFIDKDINVVSIQTMQPEPGVPDSQLRRYEPPVPVMYAIEMNAELAQKYGFEPGMRVELK